jgi:hypothetical protein
MDNGLMQLLSDRFPALAAGKVPTAQKLLGMLSGNTANSEAAQTAPADYERNPYGDAADRLISTGRPLNVISGILMKEKYAEADRRERAELYNLQKAAALADEQRKRGYAVEDRDAAQAHDINKIMFGAEQDKAKEGRAAEQARKQLIFKDFLDRRATEQKQKYDLNQQQYQRLKDANVKDANLYEAGQNPAAYNVENRRSIFSPLSWLAGKPTAVRKQAPAPQTGDEADGYVFIGGNPADPNSWRPK